MNKRNLIIVIIIIFQMLYLCPIYSHAEENSNVMAKYIEHGTDYIQSSLHCNDSSIGDIVNILEFIECEDMDINNYIQEISDEMFLKKIKNNDDISRYLLINDLYESRYVFQLADSQNPDGGFGLDKNYTSDIIDTKLALKTLGDLGEVEAMSRAVRYLITLQNSDGGFGYQAGLKSNPELTAEIADIFADCIKHDESLSEDLSDGIKKLDKYLDEHMVSIDKLSKDNLSEVYQHFHTALFKLKINGKYDITPYYALQSEDGGVFDDPMATALFLELIVREQNSLVAKLDHIAITNDDGYSVAAFDEDENVNIEIGSEYETEKATLRVTLETPSGESITINTDKLVWNTGNSEEGTYTVKAEIIRKSNDETAAKMTQTFRVEHKLAINSISLGLSQSFARVGDDVKIDVSANISLKNFSEEKNNLLIRWSVKSGDEVVKKDHKKITDMKLKENVINLGSFTPDTSERKVYLITAEIVSDDLVFAQSTTNFFVSDKRVAVIRNVNKEYLYETEDNVEIRAKIRDERVVDLIFTTSSDDTEVISKYAERIEKIKTELEKLGYVVNICSVSTSYLSAKDTFAWNEYDHINYRDSYVASIPKHIIYNENSISMLGYGYAPMKDFLLVPDNNTSQKILEFDLQRDQSNDWHTLDGGGFLFNTSIEDNMLQGYCVLVGQNGLNLIQISGVDVNRFRNGGYERVQSAGKLLKSFNIGNVLAKHHIKLVADSNTLSLWDGDNQLLENYELPANDYGNGYGPITSYTSHGCWVRSSFEFSNITMKTIAGEKLADILENYNFESPTSRYVVNLSDNSIDSLDTDEEVEEIAQKILDKNIHFIGLGNDKNSDQYQNLLNIIKEQGSYYNLGKDAAQDNLSDYIIGAEENKRVKVEDDIIATDLVFTGILYDGTEYKQTYEKLCVGETIDISIPVELIGLISGTDVVLFKDITLTYTDENGISRTKNASDITLPVKAPLGKVSNKVTSDKSDYAPYQEVEITDRIHNVSKNRTAKGLTNVISILNKDGEMVAKFSKDLSEIMTRSYIEHKETWNTTDMPDGVYTILSQVYEKDALLSESSTKITITSPELPKIDLDGELNLSGKIFKSADDIEINSLIENVGHKDVVNGKTVIKIVNGKDGSVVYQYETSLNLNISEKAKDTITVKPQTDFSPNKSGEYLVKYEVVLENGRIIPLAGDGFLLDKGLSDIIGNNVLFSMDTNDDKRGISMNGWKITINGGVHSNTNIESNCSILNIADICDSVSKPVFNTWQTNLDEGTKVAEVIELPNLLEDLKNRLKDEEILQNGGYVNKTNEQLRLYGNSTILESDIYNDKTVLIEPSNFSSSTDEGVIICSGEDVIIRSTDVNFKGIIYAPNGTVRIESSNFNLKGRVIAKNIVYQGSVFNGETYEGDLDLFE